ncbi:MAG: phosphoglycerate dehydrogenase, partial [Gammaproteobacteria bacterium]|nr:phosphoglycerate dehydrogenase [Gemmatimonadota bacterium]NIU78992.1 phosphoglycerate dehydrogenase [Gammaproteobacteria bacterium]NIX24594.1 phosphoglycerate dehydrogenase [Actinomycetota bacterium]
RRILPLLDVSERIGRLGSAMAGGRVDGLEVRYAGTDAQSIQPLVSAALIGVLSHVLGAGTVNLVNAMHHAEARNIEVHEVRL